MSTLESKGGLLKNPFLTASIGMYLNYFVHGMGVITLAQNMTHLAAKFNTNDAGIAYVISGIGLGRLISLFFFGFLSDKFGRKLMIYLGIMFYLIFFLGLLVCPNVQVAFLLAICAGAANSALDTGTYPGLMEAFPRTSGTAVILLKAVISFGQMLYPMIVSFLMVSAIWYGYAMLIPAAIIALATILIIKGRFPSSTNNVSKEEAAEMPSLVEKPKIWLEGVACALFGYTSFAAFYIVVVWMPRYAQAFAGMPEAAALKTISFYSMGSLICVFLTAVLVKKMVRPVWVIVLYSFIAGCTALVIYTNPTPFVCKAGSFIIGFTAAGGLLQLGVTTMNEFFSKSKALATSIVMILSSIANFTIPMITGYLSKVNMKYIILFDVFMAFATTIIGIIMFVRFYQIFRIPASDVRLGEKLVMKNN